MTTDKLMENSARADDLNDLLDHIAWEETIAPALTTYKNNYQDMLVKSVLGQSIVDQTTGQVVSKEMLAGRIEGIEWIKKFMLHVLKRGDAAKADLTNLGIR